MNFLRLEIGFLVEIQKMSLNFQYLICNEYYLKEYIRILLIGEGN